MLDIAASNSIVAIQLKKAITQKGLKQASIASKAGDSAQELNDMLNGRRIMRAVDIASIINVIAHLRKQVNELRIALLVTQVTSIVMTVIFGYQCLRSIWNYQYLEGEGKRLHSKLSLFYRLKIRIYAKGHPQRCFLLWIFKKERGIYMNEPRARPCNRSYFYTIK